jgi:hypothetical protein
MQDSLQRRFERYFWCVHCALGAQSDDPIWADKHGAGHAIFLRPKTFNALIF